MDQVKSRVVFNMFLQYLLLRVLAPMEWAWRREEPLQQVLR